MYAPKVKFPAAFQCYKPNSEKVYGTICMSQYNTVLLVQGRRSMKWSFPKGHKKSYETYLDCAKRETREEAGLDLEQAVPVSHQRLSVGEYYFFEVDETPPTINDKNEIIDARWVHVDDIGYLPCNVDVNNFLLRLKKRPQRP